MSRLTFSCDLAEATTPFPHFWEHTVGSDHARMALRADWQRQLKRTHEELGFRCVRFHGLLSDDIGTVVREKNRLLYSFFNSDQIFDFLLSIGMKPFVELSFMPDELASGVRTVFSYEANVTPPKDYKQWAALIEGLVSHCVERYGEKEVGEWLFEVWNEPNLKTFWTGTQREYFKLYRYTAEAIKNVSSSFKVGGPATARSEWIEEFVNFCERNDVPADFVSTHYYPNDGYESDGDTEVQLFKSQRGIMREVAQNTRYYAGDRPVYYTEWNSSSNPFDPCTTSLTPQPSRPRLCWKHTGSSMVTASGPSPIFLKRIIFRQYRFTEASDCSTCTAFRSRRIARLNCYMSSAIDIRLSTACTKRLIVRWFRKTRA